MLNYTSVLPCVPHLPNLEHMPLGNNTFGVTSDLADGQLWLNCPPISFLPPQALQHVSRLGQYCAFYPVWVEKQRVADLHTSQCPATPCGSEHFPESDK